MSIDYQARGTGSKNKEQIATQGTQLDEIVTQTKEKFDVVQSAQSALGVIPVLPLSKIKVLSPLDSNARNYAGADGVISGALTYENCLFYKGAKFNGAFMTEYTVNDLNPLPSGTIFMRFKTLQKFETGLNMDYPLFKIMDSNGVATVSAVLHYLTAQGYNGLEIRLRNGTNIKQLVIPNLIFEADTVYTIAVIWDSEVGEGNGNIACYINGTIKKATNWDTALYTPQSFVKLQVGNYATLNRPSQCTIESIFASAEKIETSGILKLHRSPLNLESINNNKIYKKEFEVVGYTRESTDYAVLEYRDGVIYGINGVGNLGILLQSLDEGITWTVFKDFTTANVVVVDGVSFINGYMYVSIRDGLIGTLRRAVIGTNVFTTILTFNSGHYCLGGWNIDSYGNKIVVSEYGQSTSLARVFLSTDNGATFNLIKTLPPTTQHIHNSKFDPYTGYIWLTWGDTIDGTEYSVDDGLNWITVTNDNNHQSISIVFTKDAVIFGSDTVSGGVALRIFDKARNTYGLMVNPTFKYLNHVYAMTIDNSGYLWWYGNREAMSGVNSTIYISPDLGATPILVDDLVQELVSKPYKFVKTKDFLCLGNKKFTQPLIKEV